MNGLFDYPKNSIRLTGARHSLVVFLSCLAAHANFRDYPISQVPLVYLVLPPSLFWISQREPGAFSRAWKAVCTPCLLVAALWSAKQCIGLISPDAQDPPSFFYLVEPILLLLFGAVVGQIQGGFGSLAKGFLWTVVAGTVWSFLCIYAGGMFEHMEIAMHSNVFSLSGEISGSMIESRILGYRNTGLTGSVVIYAYHAVAAVAIVFGLITQQFPKRITPPLILAGTVLLLGLISNAERSALGAMVFACAAGVALRRYDFRTGKLLAIIATVAAVGYGALIVEESEMRDLGRDTLVTRLKDDSGKKDPRFAMAWAAVESAFHHPLGNGGMSPFYVKRAFEEGHVYRVAGSQTVLPNAAHNHLANEIMYLGIGGLILVSALLVFLAGLFVDTWRYGHLDPWGAIFASALVGVLLNSCAHNTGLFTMEASTCLMLGGLCSWRQWVKRLFIPPPFRQGVTLSQQAPYPPQEATPWSAI